MMNFKKWQILIAAVSVMLTYACSSDTDEQSSSSENANKNEAVIRNAQNLEMPRIDSKAGKIISHYASGILNFSVDWHADKKHSRWVAFTFTRENSTTLWDRNQWKNTEWKGDPFQPDPSLREGERTELSDYRRSGYDRGHLCASADRLNTKDCNEQTFYLSNMSPQIGRFNQQDWVDLEGLVQNWGRSNTFRDTLYVVKGGTIREDQILRYTKSEMPVPKYYFMALMCKKAGTYKAIGFWVEHKSYGGNPVLSSWAVSIDELEKKTGIDFFCNLPDRIEKPIEKSFSLESWPGLK